MRRSAEHGFTSSGRSAEHGFTLMEMLAVLVIIGLIAAVAIPQVMKLLEGAKHKAAGIQIQTVGQAIGHYQLDTGAYPTGKEGLAVLLTAPGGNDGWDGPYVRDESQLKDPWGRPLLYAIPGKERAFELKSLGADGVEGGRGDDRDVFFKG